MYCIYYRLLNFRSNNFTLVPHISIRYTNADRRVLAITCIQMKQATLAVLIQNKQINSTYLSLLHRSITVNNSKYKMTLFIVACYLFSKNVVHDAS